jgi:dihydropteroate synthase
MHETTMTSAVRYVGDVQDLPALPDENETWMRPVALVTADDPVTAVPDGTYRNSSYLRLAGGWQAFYLVDVVMRSAKDQQAPFTVWRTDYSSYRAASADKARADSVLHELTTPRADIAGLKMDRPHLMGIVNVTPDSFSDGGVHLDSSKALAGARQMLADGASLVDIGGESTRPGAEPLAEQQELARIMPVIEALARDNSLISADTRRPAVMRRASAAGASFINDVSGFQNKMSIDAARDSFLHRPGKFGVVAMHMQGTPEIMQDNPHYEFAPIDVFNALQDCRDRLEAAGIPRSHIILDPGYGFGKTVAHNLDIIRWTSLFHGLGVPLLLGVSRKSSISTLMKADSVFQNGPVPSGNQAMDRLAGSLALSVQASEQGAQFIRTHDITETYQAITVARG